MPRERGTEKTSPNRRVDKTEPDPLEVIPSQLSRLVHCYLLARAQLEATVLTQFGQAVCSYSLDDDAVCGCATLCEYGLSFTDGIDGVS